MFLLYRYSFRHNLLSNAQPALRPTFRKDNAPLPHAFTRIQSFGVMHSPLNYRRRTTRLVSYYALFKWWLLLSQHPSCLSNSTSFTTEHDFGTLAADLGCFPLGNEAYPTLPDSRRRFYGIRSLIGFGNLVGPLAHSVLYLRKTISPRLILKLFRGEPAISKFDWPFTPMYSSSPSFSTPVCSVLQSVLPDFQPDHT